MKKIFLAIALSAGILTSCSLDREYLNGPNASTFPASQAEVEAGVFAGYKGLTLMTIFDTPFLAVQDNATDIGAARTGYKHTEHQQKSTLQINANLPTNVYNTIYKVAGRVNLVLDGMENVKDQMTETEYNSYRAELLLIRAYVYDLACQYYGDIAYIEHSLDLGATYNRTPREQVVDKILESLDDEMLDCLPLRWNHSEYGSARLGRVGAYGLKARICLNWGRFEDAAKYADKAITLAGEAGYALAKYDTQYCGKDHTAGEPSVTNVFGYEGYASGNEMIWSLQFNQAIAGNTHNGAYANAPRTVGGCSYWSPTQAFLDAIQCIDGKSIVESPLYDWQTPWANRDPRLDLYCVRSDTRVYGVQFTTHPNVTKVHNYNSGKDIPNSEVTGGKSEYGANNPKGNCGYLWRKYVDIQDYNIYGGSFSSSIKICYLSYPLMRLSEIYLIRAEANIEMTGGDLGVAKSDMEAVRGKVGMPALTGSSQSQLRSALRYERMVELCNEGFRWFDLRRWGIAETNMTGTLWAPPQKGLIPNGKPVIDENWHATYSETSTWDGKEFNLRPFLEFAFNPAKDYLWPIPETEMTSMPSVGQNPGY